MKLFLMFLLTLFLLVFITAILANGCFEVERDALLTFKAGLNDRGNLMSSWHGKNCCNWSGVTCDDITKHVVKLDLSNQYDWYDYYNYSDSVYLALSGKLNPALLSLSHLTHLDLSFNNFYLTIPKFIGSFENLVYLNLSLSGFHGVIPSELGNLSRLQFLDLSFCSFTGLVPLQLGNLSDLAYLSLAYSYPSINNLSWLFRLTNLRYLDMSYVDLNNKVNWLEINKMHMLETLILSSCSLSEIPINLSHVNLTALSKLDLSQNFFSEKLPNWLWNLTSLSYLDLYFCQFYGNIPKALANLASLNDLNLGENEFEHVDLEPIRKLQKLKSLNLGYLAIGGNIVNLIKRLGHMWYNLDAVYLWGNNFSGNISSLVNHIRKLTIINLSSNSLSGHMPTEIGTLTQLKELYLTSNFIGGVITEAHFVNLSKLEALDLSNNMLTMKIDDKWLPPFQLHLLSLSSCKVGPMFPTWLQLQRRLSELYLSKTGISGVVPPWFWNMPLQTIDLSYNNITGTLPASFQLSKLQGYLANNSINGPITSIGGRMPDLDLSKNQVTGNIPHAICGMKDLTILDLSNNVISEEIPVCWSNVSGLQFIDLSNNHFTGELHASIGSLEYLTVLQLDNNKLYGEIPSALQYCKRVLFLSLARNNFSGNIPAWIGNQLQDLIVLQLRWNKFSGCIPSELGKLSNLQILDISHNSLVGVIPSSLGNFSSMKSSTPSDLYSSIDSIEVTLYININGQQVYTSRPLEFAKTIILSENNLKGQIPEEIWSLQAIINLNLSKNGFTGFIPEIVGGMQSLEFLDLSFNNLSGLIPQALSNLSSLHTLNLSYNNFSGRLPTGRQLDTINVPSIYVGNPYLCGLQIDKNCSNDQESRSIHFSHGSNKSEIIWLCLAITLGFILGFWSVWGLLIFRNAWSAAYFQMIDRFFGKIYVHMSRVGWWQRINKHESDF